MLTPKVHESCQCASLIHTSQTSLPQHDHPGQRQKHKTHAYCESIFLGSVQNQNTQAAPQVIQQVARVASALSLHPKGQSLQMPFAMCDFRPATACWQQTSHRLAPHHITAHRTHHCIQTHAPVPSQHRQPAQKAEKAWGRVGGAAHIAGVAELSQMVVVLVLT